MLSMPQDDHSDHTDETVVLGVDTHKDAHVAFLIGIQGNRLAHRSFPTTANGYRRLLFWAKSFGTLRRAGVEGTLKSTKESAIKSRPQAINQLKTVVVHADPALRE
ncbi:hypothetical protein [Nocardia sp. NPDC004711]